MNWGIREFLFFLENQKFQFLMWKWKNPKKHYYLDHVMKVKISYGVPWIKCRASKIKGTSHGGQGNLSSQYGDTIVSNKWPKIYFQKIEEISQKCPKITKIKEKSQNQKKVSCAKTYLVIKVTVSRLEIHIKKFFGKFPTSILIFLFHVTKYSSCEPAQKFPKSIPKISSNMKPYADSPT